MSTRETQFRPTWVEISQAALVKNLDVVRRAVTGDVGILAMVKADAYGHGAIRIATWLAEAGVQGLGVATIEEGLELRNAGLTLPIIVMGGFMGQGREAAEAAVAHQLTCVMHSVPAVALLDRVATDNNVTVPFHLKVDTGMSRMGARPEMLDALCTAVASASQLRLEGVMTHLAHVVDRDVTAQQVATFCEAARAIRTRVDGPLCWHIGNSAAIIDQCSPAWHWCTPFPVQAGDTFWVRPGIMLYGIRPFEEYRDAVTLNPVMAIKSRVALIKHIPVGTGVSYGGTWQAARPSRIGVLPIGYADGYGWRLGNCGMVACRGQRLPIVGRVTMDMVMCDLTEAPMVEVGEAVTLLGAEVTAEEHAAWSDTIPYEVTCRVSKRVPKVYQ